jgi:hypothetical protein
VLYADVFSSTSFVINTRYHRIHSLATYFNDQLYIPGRVVVQKQF